MCTHIFTFPGRKSFLVFGWAGGGASGGAVRQIPPPPPIWISTYVADTRLIRDLPPVKCLFGLDLHVS